MSFGHFVRELWTSCSWALDILFVSFLHLVRELWASCSWALDILFVSFGHLVRELWTSCSWAFYILFVSFGHLVRELWTSCSWALGNILPQNFVHLGRELRISWPWPVDISWTTKVGQHMAQWWFGISLLESVAMILSALFSTHSCRKSARYMPIRDG